MCVRVFVSFISQLSELIDKFLFLTIAISVILNDAFKEVQLNSGILILVLVLTIKDCKLRENCKSNIECLINSI